MGNLIDVPLYWTYWKSLIGEQVIRTCWYLRWYMRGGSYLCVCAVRSCLAEVRTCRHWSVSFCSKDVAYLTHGHEIVSWVLDSRKWGWEKLDVIYELGAWFKFACQVLDLLKWGFQSVLGSSKRGREWLHVICELGAWLKFMIGCSTHVSEVVSQVVNSRKWCHGCYFVSRVVNSWKGRLGTEVVCKSGGQLIEVTSLGSQLVFFGWFGWSTHWS